MAFELPPLPYPSSALEPHIDARTMEIHHDKHHAAYVSKADAALEGTEWSSRPVEEVIANLDAIAADKRTAVRNNGGGHANHSLFWKIMSPNGGGKPSGELAKAIDDAFGSFDQFKDKLNDAAANRFGSGWGWLGLKQDGKLCVCSTPNQDNPLMGANYVDCPCKPILGVDVWEHAYYLNYQNRRPDYLAAWWNVINWKQVEDNFAKAKRG